MCGTLAALKSSALSGQVRLQGSDTFAHADSVRKLFVETWLGRSCQGSCLAMTGSGGRCQLSDL